MEAQGEIKRWYDRRAREKKFQPGDRVLVLFPVQGHPLKARLCGPWEVEKKFREINYIVKTHERRKENQLCYVNILKPYHKREIDGESKEQNQKKSH